jgi:hypothetical protein
VHKTLKVSFQQVTRDPAPGTSPHYSQDISLVHGIEMLLKEKEKEQEARKTTISFVQRSK